MANLTNYLYYDKMCLAPHEVYNEVVVTLKELKNEPKS
jgi:hypothetical protein